MVKAKRKASLVPQMSAPDPDTTNWPVLLSNVALPAAPTAPMSALDHPAGSVLPPEPPAVTKLHTGPVAVRFAIVRLTTCQ